MKRVAVLRGGPSTEHEVSLKTGGAILRSLANKNYATKDILITKSGEWLEGGLIKKPETALAGIDVVFLGLHGTYGEDGQVQRYLQTHKIPYTGSRAFSSALAFNKAAAKRALGKTVTQPKHFVVTGDSLWAVASQLDDLHNTLGDELFIKPIAEGSSQDAYRVTGKNALENAVEALLPKYQQLLIEEFIVGREATVGVLENYRGEEHYALPVIEILPPHDQAFFSRDAKYNGRTEYICPGRFTYEEKQQMSNLAIQCHRQLGCAHYSRTDFIVTDTDIYFLETNTLPGFTENSLYPKAAKAVGLEFDDLVEHLLLSAHV